MAVMPESIPVLGLDGAPCSATPEPRDSGCHLSFTILPLPSTISHPSSAVRRSPFAIYHLSSVICHLPFTIRHPPSAICHLPSVIRHLPFAICHPQPGRSQFSAVRKLQRPVNQNGPPTASWRGPAMSEAGRRFGSRLRRSAPESRRAAATGRVLKETDPVGRRTRGQGYPICSA